MFGTWLKKCDRQSYQTGRSFAYRPRLTDGNIEPVYSGHVRTEHAGNRKRIMSLSTQSSTAELTRLRKNALSFRDMMQTKVREILIVASHYDSFKLEEDGRLTELIFAEYQNMSFLNAPHVNRASSASHALTILQKDNIDLIITMSRISDMEPFEFARRVKKKRPNLPVILMVSSVRECSYYTKLELENPNAIDKIFYWSGNSAVLPAIIKYSEDIRNAEQDIRKGFVKAIIVVEDSPQYYSAFLPMLYKLIRKHMLWMMKQEYDDNLRTFRALSRPKILLASSFEKGLEYYEQYQRNILAVISDLKFPYQGRVDDRAGIKFLETIQAREKSLPLVLQSLESCARQLAEAINVRFFDKNSPRLVDDIRSFIMTHCGFDDLVFHLGEKKKPLVVKDLRSLENALEVAPQSQIRNHGQHNHFSNWLAMRGYLEFASIVKSIPSPTNENEVEDLRELLKALVKKQRDLSHEDLIVEYFNPDFYDPGTNLVRIGEGSVGGKARSLIFISMFLKRTDWAQRYRNIYIGVPNSALIGSDIFDDFLMRNAIRDRLHYDDSDEKIDQMFQSGILEPGFCEYIKSYLTYRTKPLAIRSSSLLEDSVFQPFAGIYKTIMVPNCAPNLAERTDMVLEAIKLVFASTFHRKARSYLKSTGNRMEDEKMAIIIQDVIGESHNNFYYPTFAGNLRTYNFYPFDRIKRKDGIANLALGLGKTVMGGERSLRYSPRYPKILPQFYNRRSILASSQSHFYAIKLDCRENNSLSGREDDYLERLPLRSSEEHGTLEMVASVYCLESEAFNESLHKKGPRIITFANILKCRTIPLSRILKDMIKFGRKGMGCEVEIEFAVNIPLDKTKSPTFAILQIRPLITQNTTSTTDLGHIDSKRILCKSNNCIGNGLTTTIKSIVQVKTEGFQKKETPRIAMDIGKINKSFKEKDSYLLIGPGRWGSADSFLGIPVEWNNISKVGAIIEVGLPDFHVEPSFGSHFFQNLISLGIPYLCISPSEYREDCALNWLKFGPPAMETKYLYRYNFADPLTIQIDGKLGKGIVLRPA